MSLRPAVLMPLACLLAGCATPRPAAPPPVAAPQGVFYSATVLAVRPLTADNVSAPALDQVEQALGAPAAAPPAGAQELILQLPDGSVKTLVPPPGAAPQTLAPGAAVTVTETPTLHINVR